MLAVIGFAALPVWAQTPQGSKFFPETGHWITGDFLEKYLSTPNATVLYGNPITEAYVDELTGLEIQYFEKARFERYPDSNPDLRVKISNLGAYLYEKGATFPWQPVSSACRLYTEGGESYQVCYTFLDFFDDNGGVAQFGYPVSNFEAHDGWIVQYFQKARFEWHPENLVGQRVVVSNLGSQFFRNQGENPELLRPARLDAIPLQETTSIRVRAFVENAVMPLSGRQTLSVIVQDQNLRPLENARANFEVVYANGERQFLQMPLTNARGITQQQFWVEVQSPGIVSVTVTVTYRVFQSITKTSFQTWW